MWRRIIQVPIESRGSNDHRAGEYTCLQQKRSVLEVALPERSAEQHRRPANGGPVKSKESPNSEKCGYAAEIALHRGQAAVELTEKFPPPVAEAVTI